MITRPLRALIGLSVIVVLLGVVVSALWWLNHRNSQIEAARTAALQAAGEQVAMVLAGEATAPATGQDGVEVIASAVVRAAPEQVVVLLFVNQTTSTPPSEMVQLSAHRIELNMIRRDGRWLASELERV
ncbi:MAG: hypothetical protein ACRDTC_14360 [Pseudonocardiaceae bacterium]